MLVQPKAQSLALTLFVFRVLADDHHAAFALDDLALFANRFDGRFHLHDWYLLQGLLVLFRAPGDTALGQIVGAELQRDFVAGQNANEVHAQLSGDMSCYLVPVFEFHQKHGVRHSFENGAL